MNRHLPAPPPPAEECLPGRLDAVHVPAAHFVNGHPLVGPWPEGFDTLVVAMGCFWGAERLFFETLSAWATGRTTQVMMWGRTAGYIDQYAPPDKRNPEVFQVWPKTIGPMGKAPLTQFDNEPWVIYTDAPADEKAA